MSIIIKNAKLISMSEKREKIEEDVDIKIVDNKIAQIGKNISTEDAEKIIEANGKVVMPGLINAHAHVPMSLFRETVDGYKLQDWLTKKIWPMEDKLTSEDIYYATLLTFIEMIKTGTTTINDMYFLTEDIIRAAKEAKIRLQTTRTLMGEVEESNTRLNELDELIKKYKDTDELVTFNAGLHGLYTCNLEYAQKCVEYAKQNNLILHTHFCENTKEVEDIKNAYHKKPIEVLEEEFKDVKSILAHGVKLDNDDIEILSKLNTSVVHCPVSNLRLGCGVANITEMLNKNINVALGTDGQGSGSNMDLFEQMKFAALMQKGIKEDPTLIPAYEVLKMATINGAKALGLEDKIGSIEEGKEADIIMIDLNCVTTQPVNDIFSDIVYNVKGTNVDTTIVNGQILMEKRKTNFEEKEIFKKCKEIIDRIR